MYFVAMLVQLRFRRPHAPLTVADGVYAHAAVHSTIQAADAQAGRSLHEMGRNKRLTTALVDSTSRAAMLRLTFMAADGLAYANLLVNALQARPVLRLGGVVCEVQSVDLVDSEWCGVCNWADLTAGVRGRYLRFAFVTPAAFMKRDGDGGRFTSVLPEAGDLFRGLARRWHALTGPELPGGLEQFLRAGGCVISNFDLQAARFRTRERAQVGFTGWVVYECRRQEPKYVEALNALARMAFFTGVGYQTARGMGAVQTKISN